MLLLEKAGAPAYLSAAASADPEAARRSMLGSSRAGTIRCRVRAWEEYTRWLSLRRGRVWPETVLDLTDYVHERMRDRPVVSFPLTFSAAATWFEARSGYEDRFASSEGFCLTIERARADTPESEEATKRAPRFPLSLIAALEVAVVSESLTKGMRVVAWARLLKIYGTLRADDLQRLRPKLVVMGESGLTGTLLRTKTSGPGKKVKQLTVFIPLEAQVSGHDWLRCGYDLWKDLVGSSADYFLPRLSPSTEGFENKLATPMDVSGMNTYVLTLLSARAASGLAGGLLEAGGDKLVDTGLESAWTGHSERSSLPSLAAALGIPKCERDYLGRWSPSGSDEYVRTYRAVVRKTMTVLTDAVRGGMAYNLLDEAEAYETAVAALVRKGLDPVAAKILETSAKEKAKVILDALKVHALAASGTKARFIEPSTARTEEEINEEKMEGKEEDEAKYIISVGRRRHGPTVDCLHRKGGCWRARSLAFSSYELVSLDPPPSASYGTVCKQCWPLGDPDFDADEDGDSSDEDSDLNFDPNSGTEESADQD